MLSHLPENFISISDGGGILVDLSRGGGLRRGCGLGVALGGLRRNPLNLNRVVPAEGNLWDSRLPLTFWRNDHDILAQACR
jgi:hypothetical protein